MSKETDLVRLNVALPPDLYKALRVAAIEQKTMRQVIINALTQYLNHQ